MQRLSDDVLLALLRDLESDRVERKALFKGDVPGKARQAVCAFSNDFPGHQKPGVLFVGATDDGQASGLEVTDQLLLQLADIKTDGNILPLPVLTVERRTLDGMVLAVVTVQPSDMPPVKYDGRIWLRTGPRRSLATEQEERILIERRRHRLLPFDLRPVPGALLRELSRHRFEDEYLPHAFAPDVLEANGRSYEERLASCKLIVSPDEPIPTVTGLMALGKSPQDFLPGASIQFIRIDGTDLADPVIDSALLTGALPEILRRADDKLRAHNHVAVDITSGARHRSSTPYPMPALHQLLYNAVLHRTYEGTHTPVRLYWFSDRIEIFSPGGPYGSVTVENFGRPGITDYRNPNIASVMKIYGYIQAFGRGIATARRALLHNGNPEPTLLVDVNSVAWTLYRRPD